jgi:predicted branched-subunit amino acid permease
LAPILKPLGLGKLLPALLTIDESTAVATAQKEIPAQKKGFWLTGAAVFVFWNLMTFFGAVLGDALGDPKNFGLDAAAAAAFLGLIWPRLMERQTFAVAALAILIATFTTPYLPAGVPVLVAGLSAVVFGLFNWLKPKEQEDK